MAALCGQLEVTVLAGYNLKNAETFTKQDPYIVLQLGNARYRGKTCNNGGTNPTWNERFHFTTTNELDLALVVWNSNSITSDDCLGSCRISLTKVYEQKADDVRVPVQDPSGKSAGELHVIMRFTPNMTAQSMASQPAAKSHREITAVPSSMWRLTEAISHCCRTDHSS